MAVLTALYLQLLELLIYGRFIFASCPGYSCCSFKDVLGERVWGWKLARISDN